MPALGDVIVDALTELLRVLFTPIEGVIQEHGDSLLRMIVGTPRPNAVFGRPTNGAWPRIYDYYWDTLIPVVLFLWGLSIGIVIFFESTSHLFSGYHRSKLKKRAFSGLLGVLSWWWLAAISLRFIDALTGFLVPVLSEITLFETLSFSAMGVLGLLIALSVDFILFFLIALIYFTRQVVLYLFVLLMPFLIVLWIPGIGPFKLVSRFMKQLAGFYVPFLFMTVPVALLLRLGGLLGGSFELSMGGFGAWVAGLVIPLVALASPFVLFWQAGALFFLADRASHHASRRLARDRVDTARAGGEATARGGENFARGLRDEPAVTRDGQVVFDSGSSRTHAAGSRLKAGGSRLRGTLQKRGGGGSGGSENRGNGGGDDGEAGGTRGDDGEAGGTRADQPSEGDRNAEFGPLRDRERGRETGSGRGENAPREEDATREGSANDRKNADRGEASDRDGESDGSTDDGADEKSDTERPWYIN